MKSPKGISILVTVATVQIIFIAEKVMHRIDWSWMWVLSPIWIFNILVVIGAICVFIFSTIHDNKF